MSLTIGLGQYLGTYGHFSTNNLACWLSRWFLGNHQISFQAVYELLEAVANGRVRWSFMSLRGLWKAFLVVSWSDSVCQILISNTWKKLWYLTHSHLNKFLLNNVRLIWGFPWSGISWIVGTVYLELRCDLLWNCSIMILIALMWARIPPGPDNFKVPDFSDFILWWLWISSKRCILIWD